MILKYKIHYKFYCVVYSVIIYLLYTDTRLGSSGPLVNQHIQTIIKAFNTWRCWNFKKLFFLMLVTKLLMLVTKFPQNFRCTSPLNGLKWQMTPTYTQFRLTLSIITLCMLDTSLASHLINCRLGHFYLITYLPQYSLDAR
jgi:hypothetical protein